MQDILENTSDDLEQVTIEPSGRWSVPSAQKEVRPKASEPDVFNLDDDDAFGSYVGNRSYNASLASRPSQTPNRPTTSSVSYGTPESRESSRPAVGSKRSAAEVIDLTLSDDDDDDGVPGRQTKRPNLGTNSYGHGFL
jgi:E3 SUMO-protein ligase PIAS1